MPCLIEAGNTRVLVDCGFGPRNLAERCQRLGVEADTLDAILVTHEHSDHVGGPFPAPSVMGSALYMTHGTHAEALRDKGTRASIEVDLHLIDSHTLFSIGDLLIQPFPGAARCTRTGAVHVFSDGAHELGVLDRPWTCHLACGRAACKAAMHWCWSAITMPTCWRAGPYPPMLKQRVGGRFGHLANDAAAALLLQLDCSRLAACAGRAYQRAQQYGEALAQQALADAMGCSSDWIGVADQELGFGWRSLS